MPEENLQGIMEAVLFAAGDPVTTGQLMRILELEEDAVEAVAADLAAKFYVLVCPEAVGVLQAPGLVKEGRAHRAHGLLPVVAGDEAAAGPPEDRHLDAAHGLQHVGAEAVLVCEGTLRIIDPAVDLAMKMLDELSVDHIAANRLHLVGADC